jgi:VWFA-related protein
MANAQGNRSSYELRIPVNEIGLTFHASDASGAPLTALTRSDVSLLDDGKRQTQIVMFESLQNLPIRAGFLFDSSASMMKNLAANRAVITMYASGLLRKGVDRAMVMQFGTIPLITQSWTGDTAAIAAGAARVGPKSHLFDPFTAIFDSLYATCRDQFSQVSGKPVGNFILLFSDGEDDASHVYLSEAVDMCQRTRMAIYAIVDGRKSGYSDGQRTLKELAGETGGRVFFREPGAPVWDDLKTIEEEQRNQYRLVYRPTDFKADGSFHRLKVDCVVKGARIVARSGYYSFARP